MICIYNISSHIMNTLYSHIDTLSVNFNSTVLLNNVSYYVDISASQFANANGTFYKPLRYFKDIHFEAYQTITSKTNTRGISK